MDGKHNFFESGQLASDLAVGDLDARIASAVQHMTTKTTSKLEGQFFEKNISRELSRQIASRALNSLAARGIEISQIRMMDLGAGLGTVSEEAAFRGATPVAIEPGSGFREITLQRIRRSGSGVVVAAMAETLPFRDSSFDGVVSIQVLEHVQDPAAAISEVYRTLKPGGWFYFSCPNYLSFYEGHYDILWLPLLPKFLGSLYLRLRGRPTEFLSTSITYTTVASVRRALRRCGFITARERTFYHLCRSPGSIKRSWKRNIIRAARRLVSADSLAKALLLHNQLTHLFIRNFNEFAQKPDRYPDRGDVFSQARNASTGDV